MEITIQIPAPLTTARIAAVVDAIAGHTGRPFRALVVEAPEYDKDRVDVRGTVKGVGSRTWEKWTVAARVALKRVGDGYINFTVGA